MTKVRSREECLGAIQADSAWRKKEIAALKGRLVDSEKGDMSALLRCAVVMIYAHWEGFVKTACEIYLTFVNEMIARRAVELSEHFTDLLMWKMLRRQGEHLFMKNPVPFLQMRRKWPCPSGELLPTEIIDTESNLTSKVLKRLTATMNIDYSIFETKAKLIDDNLLMRRNRIAHGERMAVEPEDYEVIERETRELIDSFQELIETSVQTEQYRAAPSGVTTVTPP